MSDFKFGCPRCGQHLRCHVRHVGRQILCPKCQGLIVIPDPSGEAVLRTPLPPSSEVDATIAPQLSLRPAGPPVSMKPPGGSLEKKEP
jgi:hypothetical protein